MRKKKLMILFILVSTLMIITGLSFNGKALSINKALLPGKLGVSQQFSLPSAIRDQTGLAQSASQYSGYTQITDNEEKIRVQVPDEWGDIDTGSWVYKGRNMGVFVAASGDLANFYSTRSQSGVLIGVSHSLANLYGKQGMLEVEKRDFAGRCSYKGRFDYRNQFYSGQYDQFANCATGSPSLLVLTTTSADQKMLILIRIVIASQADVEAANTIINTFQVLGNPERDDHHD